ncbi:MAG: LysR family transcriptional regulator, partial [Haliea sp.]
TQSAVSKQIQELERTVGMALFERVRQRMALTPAGQRYADAVRPLLLQIETATFDLMTSADGGGALHLSVLPTFGAKWLIPRLPLFQQAHPKITLHFVPYVQGYDFHRADLDCSILFGDGHWPGAVAHYLAGREVVLIAPPSGARRPRLRKPADVVGQTLIQHISVPWAWSHWFTARGIEGVNALAGPQMDQYHSLIRAVSAGMGLALVPRCLVQDDITAGTVSAPLDDDFVDTPGYWLCHPEARAHLPALEGFKAWLLAECALAG